MVPGDVIAAISTPPGRGGIGVVRLSGLCALDIASLIFRAESESPIEPNRARFGHLIQPETGDSIDQIVLTWFKAPHSYTGEDVVELSCHGSPLILARVLDVVLKLGARLAEPGEFTFRAFFNRRIDLAQAQAVRDLIDAQTEYQARVARRQLGGALSQQVTPLKEAMIEVVVHLETSLEFVEDEVTTEARSGLISRLDRVIEALEDAAGSFAFGRYLKDGFDLAIVGRPNVGKSSVFNRLIGADRAIVTEMPGTTRDALYEQMSISGVPVRLIDTAGIRETTDVVESIGIGRSRNAIADADVSLLVLDASESLTNDDLRLLADLADGRRIIAYNKIDLLGSTRPGYLDAGDAVPISALTGEGFNLLTDAILKHLSGDSTFERDGIMVTDARQHASLSKAASYLREGRDLMIEGEVEEVIVVKLRAALSALGEITGETMTDDILNQIFSTFCIGK
ncbi:MAG TPA: tRNA uridine-5-carboxymethylaminomethyl(34) synthesis GTPase MnmE [Blastocatellia bacterium]|jgi:tRNA modification GTPase|nr:tRNA uridine-5-carboxymethylaminomethyl(34) synthesis GTPase MnmE [Blastocatellia bacterium]